MFRCPLLLPTPRPLTNNRLQYNTCQHMIEEVCQLIDNFNYLLAKYSFLCFFLVFLLFICVHVFFHVYKGKGSLYSITDRRVTELIPVLGSQPAGDVSHKPGGRLPILSARPAITLATLKRAATNFAAW